MSWVNLALLSTITLGLVSIFDSHLISKRLPSLRVFMLLFGSMYIIYGLVAFYLFPLPEGTSLKVSLVAVASATLRSGAVLIMLNMLKREEVSRVVPVVYAYPIFVAIMAVPLLGESLSYLEWLAIIIVVAGAVMISARRSTSGGTTWLGKPFLLLLSSSLLMALGDISSKYVLSYISFLNMFWLSSFSITSLCLLISLRPRTFKQLRDIKQKKLSIGLVVFNETLALVGILMLLWAIQKGPISMVSTVNASRPVFVLMFALILSRALPTFLEWQRGKKILALRLAATAMVVGGITIIHLT